MEPVALYSDESERICIAGPLYDSKRIDEIIGLITPGDFYREGHRQLWQGLCFLHSTGKEIDAATLYTEATKHQGWTGDLNQICAIIDQEGWKSSAIVQHAKMVRDYALLRGLQRAVYDVNEGLGKVHPSEAAEVADRLDAAVLAIRQRQMLDDGPQLIRNVLIGTMGSLEDRCRNQTNGAMVKTGLQGLDQIIGGVMRKKVCYIGGRPSMGKSALLQTILLNMGNAGVSCALFSTEDDRETWTIRALSAWSGISAFNLTVGKYHESDFDLIFDAANRLSMLPVAIDDVAGLSPEILRARVRQLKRQHGTKVVGVDYIQQMRPPAGRRYGSDAEAIAATSRALVSIAKELDVALIVAAQLNRENTKRGDKRPTLADFKGSGEIEQDAWQVIFPHREMMFDKDADPSKAELIVAKNKNGGLGTAFACWNGPTVSFCDGDGR